jgi:uncharacterized protein
MTDTVKSYSAMLRLVLGDRLKPDAETFFEMVAPDGVVEFVFAPPGMSRRLEGKEALAKHLSRVGGRINFDRMSEPVIHETSDPEVLIIEFEGFGRGVATGEPYEQRYISVIRTRGGHIVHIKEYWDPLAVLSTLKGAAVVEELAGGLWPDT